MNKINYEPSFEVVDKAEEAEDYLLAKNRQKGDCQYQTKKGDCLVTDATGSNNNNSTNNIESAAMNSKENDMKMNFTGVPFVSGTSESNNEVIPDTTGSTVEELKCMTEEEEGQEALWLEEAEVSPSSCSTATASLAVVRSSTKRSSFLFGSAISKKATSTIPPKRTISFRKKRNPPKVMLLDGGLLDAENITVPASVPATSSRGVTPGAVITSDTISTLGFDKSFDVKSPLSMSSLNEILDAPITPTTAAVEESAVVASTEKSTTKKSLVRNMFRKKDKKVKATKKSFSFLNRYARTVAVVVKEDKDDDDDAEILDPALLATRDIDKRIQESLLRAMENDDVESLTSFNGVPMILKEESNPKQPIEKPKSVTVLQGQRPLNFEKIKPTFVVSKDGPTLAQIQEKFVPMDFEDEDDEENNFVEQQNLASPSTVDGSNVGEEIEALTSSSPNSAGVDSAVTDRYEVARNMEDDIESDCDDGKSDKYSVLPDPCSFCDSFWINTDHQATVSNTMSESPGMTTDGNHFEPESTLDSPVVDKYAELPEVAEHVASTEQEETTIHKSTTVVTSKRSMSSLFGKFKRPTTSSELPEMVSASSSGTNSRSLGLACPEPEEKEDVVVESTVDEQTTVVASKRTMSSFFVKAKQPKTALPESLEAVPANCNDTSNSDQPELMSPEPEDNVPVDSTDDEPVVTFDERESSIPTESTVIATKRTTSSFFGKFQRSSVSTNKTSDIPAEPTISEIDSSMNVSAPATKSVPRKSILKKRKSVMMIPVDDSISTFVVPGKDVESPGAKISVHSVGSEPYVVPAATTNTTMTSKTTASSMEQTPLEDPSTEGSSSADDEAAASTKIVSIAAAQPTSSTKSTSTDPLLVRLRRNLHLRSPTQKQRGLEPQTEVDPIIFVGTGRTRMDP